MYNIERKRFNFLPQNGAGKADMGHQTGLILRYDHGWTDNAISARICRYVSFTFAIAYRPFYS
jgi:hypothetical protein